MLTQQTKNKLFCPLNSCSIVYKMNRRVERKVDTNHNYLNYCWLLAIFNGCKKSLHCKESCTDLREVDDGISAFGDNIFLKCDNSVIRLILVLEEAQRSNNRFIKSENKLVSINIDL